MPLSGLSVKLTLLDTFINPEPLKARKTMGVRIPAFRTKIFPTYLLNLSTPTETTALAADTTFGHSESLSAVRAPHWMTIIS